MRRFLVVVLLTCAAYVAAGATPAVAQSGPPSAVESINVTVTGGQPIDMFFPNEFDPLHPKDLILNVTVTSLDPPGTGGTLFWAYDWIDLTGMPVMTPPGRIDLPGGASVPLVDTFRIPFCPQQVSLHFNSDGTFNVAGTFTHICIPEPSSCVLGALGLVGLVGWQVRRRRVK